VILRYETFYNATLHYKLYKCTRSHSVLPLFDLVTNFSSKAFVLSLPCRVKPTRSTTLESIHCSEVSVCFHRPRCHQGPTKLDLIRSAAVTFRQTRRQTPTRPVHARRPKHVSEPDLQQPLLCVPRVAQVVVQSTKKYATIWPPDLDLLTARVDEMRVKRTRKFASPRARCMYHFVRECP
jgi:hypothetical protein